MDEESGVKRLVLKVKATNPNKDHEEHVCAICNKGFISGKALGGHMRIHSTPDKTNKLDLSASLPPGWAATAKRGRKRLASCKSSSPLLPGIQQRILKSVVDLYSVVYINANRRYRSDAIGDDEILDKKSRRKRARKMGLFESETTEPNSYTCSI